MELRFFGPNMPTIRIAENDLPKFMFGFTWRERAEAAIELLGPKLAPEYETACMYDSGGTYLAEWEFDGDATDFAFNEVHR
jgi:hypothetical protein